MSYEVAVALGVTSFSLIFAYLAINIGKKHGPLQILFIILTPIFMTINAVVISKIATDGSATELADLIDGVILSPLIWLSVLIVAYFIIYFIYNVLMDMAQKKERGWTVDGD